MAATQFVSAHHPDIGNMLKSVEHIPEDEFVTTMFLGAAKSVAVITGAVALTTALTFGGFIGVAAAVAGASLLIFANDLKEIGQVLSGATELKQFVHSLDQRHPAQEEEELDEEEGSVDSPRFGDKHSARMQPGTTGVFGGSAMPPSSSGLGGGDDSPMPAVSSGLRAAYPSLSRTQPGVLPTYERATLNREVREFDRAMHQAAANSLSPLTALFISMFSYLGEQSQDVAGGGDY